MCTNSGSSEGCAQDLFSQPSGPLRASCHAVRLDKCPDHFPFMFAKIHIGVFLTNLFTAPSLLSILSIWLQFRNCLLNTSCILIVTTVNLGRQQLLIWVKWSVLLMNKSKFKNIKRTTWFSRSHGLL